MERFFPKVGSIFLIVNDIVSHFSCEYGRLYQLIYIHICLISKKKKIFLPITCQKSKLYIRRTFSNFSKSFENFSNSFRKFGKGIDQCQTRTNFSIINPRSITLPEWKGDNYFGSRNRSKFPASFKRAWEVRGKSI